MRKLVHVAAGFVFALAVPLAAQDDPAALIIRVQGDVQVVQGGGAPTAAAVGTRLAVGDEIRPAQGARAMLITRTGASQTVTETTSIPEPQGGGNPDMFTRAMSTLAQAASTDATMGGRQGMIRPIPGQTTLVGPRNGLTVSVDRPEFVWTGTPDASYDLMLQKEGERPQMFEVGADTAWTYPEDLEPLEYGATYSWTIFVGGRRGGRALPPQKFQVIDIVEYAELTEFMDEIEVLGLDPMGDGLFLTVVALRDLDLFYDADDAMEDLEGQGELSADLYMLKGEILATLGHEAEARAAFDKADAVSR